MGEKKFLESIEDGELDIAVYARSWEEGDNVTVTCDLLFAMEQAVGVFNEQKVKIERLTEWKDKLQDTKDELEQQLIDTGFKEYCEENKRLTDENAELQKQVDELKTKQVIECYGMIKGCDMVKQAVKDTAKEIYHLIDMFPIPTRKGQQRYATGFENGLSAIKLKIAERYGVEVE